MPVAGGSQQVSDVPCQGGNRRKHGPLLYGLKVLLGGFAPIIPSVVLCFDLVPASVNGNFLTKGTFLNSELHDIPIQSKNKDEFSTKEMRHILPDCTEVVMRLGFEARPPIIQCQKS